MYFEFDSAKKCSSKISSDINPYSASRVVGLYGRKGSGKSELVQSKLKGCEGRFGKVFKYQFPSDDIKNVAKELKEHFESYESSAIKNPTEEIKNKGGFTLVILDGFQQAFREHLRILYHNRRGTCGLRDYCMVLLIARNKDDFKSVVDDCFIYHLGPLEKNEAIELIKYILGFDDKFPISKVAQEIATKCIGSPGLITDVVSSLKLELANKYMPIENWKETSDSLNHTTARNQIFLNFRGSNTREGFARRLYQALDSKGFETFMDDESLKNGEDIDKLLDEIGESRCAIVILSEDYADSEWCLKELVKILKCRKSKNQLVLPIFYEVEPTVIKNLKGKYGRAMAKHKKKPEYSEWKQALTGIIAVSGKPYKRPQDQDQDKYQAQFIEKYVDMVYDLRYRLHIQRMYES